MSAFAEVSEDLARTQIRMGSNARAACTLLLEGEVDAAARCARLSKADEVRERVLLAELTKVAGS